MLLQGQAKLVEEVETTDALLEFASLGTMEFADGDPSTFSQYDGQRNKLLACDGNQIDTMFVDRRRVGGANGQTLVKACNRGLCECCSYQSRWDFFLKKIPSSPHRSSAAKGTLASMRSAA